MEYEFPEISGNWKILSNERLFSVLEIRSTWKTALPKGRKGVHDNDGFFKSFEDIQREHIIKALERTNWRVTGTKAPPNC